MQLNAIKSRTSSLTRHSAPLVIVSSSRVADPFVEVSEEIDYLIIHVDIRFLIVISLAWLPASRSPYLYLQLHSIVG